MLKSTSFNEKSGVLYFYIHFVVEVVCFYFLSSLYRDRLAIWFIPLIYDALAFVPQSIFGYINDLYPKLNLSIIGMSLLLLAILLTFLKISIFIPLIILCIGNALVHVRGAEVTLKNGKGYLCPSALFVSGGSFGVIIGKLLASIKLNSIWLIILIITSIPFILDAELNNESKSTPNCKDYNFANKKINPYLTIILAVIVVIIRGFIGYGIPTSWNKTMIEAVIFYFTMGLGKALGGILVDKIGIRPVIILSTIISIPFLCFGNKMMLISLIGVALFSMTMAITLGILVSILPKKPGLAFGLTTIGLFLGTVPIFFIKLNPFMNIVIIIVSSLACAGILLKISNKEDYENHI